MSHSRHWKSRNFTTEFNYDFYNHPRILSRFTDSHFYIIITRRRTRKCQFLRYRIFIYFKIALKIQINFINKKMNYVRAILPEWLDTRQGICQQAIHTRVYFFGKVHKSQVYKILFQHPRRDLHRNRHLLTPICEIKIINYRNLCWK